MPKPHYIKDKNGKFAGSIGVGKTAPTFQLPPVLPPVQSHTTYEHDPENLCVEIANEYDQMPDFTESGVDIASILLPYPPVSEREQWAAPYEQERIEMAADIVVRNIHRISTPEDFEGRNPADVDWVSSERKYNINVSLWHADFYTNKAQELWEHGKYYQASTYFVLATAARQAAENAEEYAVAVRQGQPVKQRSVNMDSVNASVRYALTGAVVMDFLRYCQGDPDAAAAMAALAESSQDVA